MKANIPIVGVFSLLISLWRKLGYRRKCQFLALLGLMLLSALAEIISLGAVLPFIGILTVPESIFDHPILSDLVRSWGVSSASQLVLPITVIFASAALMAGGIRILLIWVSTRIAFACGAEIGTEVYRRSLYQPYRVHLARSSSEVISGITIKVNGVVFGVLLPLLTLISSVVLLVAISFTLFVIDPVVALVLGIGFSICYGLIIYMMRSRLYKNSQAIAQEQTKVLKALQEGLGGIREVLLNGMQPAYCDIYRQADKPLRQAQGNNSFIGACPRYIMEAVGMVLIAILAYSLSKEVGGIASALPLLGALALGAQRLLPILQQIYSAWASIAGNKKFLIDTIELLEQPMPSSVELFDTKPLVFEKEILFKDVGFRYENNGPWILNRINLAIPKGARVGFVGSTGSGKSTTLDILMGLLNPTEGQLLVDGLVIDSGRLRAWQKNIAHVPQNIYLADTSLAENIAFGVPLKNINMDRVRKAAYRAQIADFIESRWEGYSALVGERGVRLSGGQRQRIGIARALYKNANVLVFDEATSALDNNTEESMMQSIEGLGHDFTIVMVAHRLTTVRNCDFIMELEHGKIVAKGSYDDLLRSSLSFQKMARKV